MIVVVLVNILKLALNGLLLVLFPLNILSFVLPPIVLDSISSFVHTVVLIFVWLFGLPAYNFFLLTVTVTTLSIPTFHLSVFIFHLFTKIKRFFI